ncbi:MAG: tryptophan--tRNA ligase [Candidatus Coatesbacteria bacterium]|nr:tryptophan--tRNA ligase [Candidatus Coatesbacteria bacterium]
MEKRVLSGIQPSGRFHLGNYFSMIKPMIEYQKKNKIFCFIVNLHALTSVQSGDLLRKQTFESALDLLALGLDPEKNIFWVQNDVNEIMELTWYLSCVTPKGLLERCHSYKDKVAKGIPASHGLFSYPVLMAADILLYQGEIIPVGKDQKQHVEVTRDIAIKFNNTYGEVFKLPEPEISEDTGIIPGIDGQKMSKSYNNTIDIFAEKTELKKQIMSIVTDSKAVEDPKNPDESILLAIMQFFVSEEEFNDWKTRFWNGGTGYGETKKYLLEIINNYFTPFREKREEYSKDRELVLRILRNGADKAREIAMVTLNEVRKRVGTKYY